MIHVQWEGGLLPNVLTVLSGCTLQLNQQFGSYAYTFKDGKTHPCKPSFFPQSFLLSFYECPRFSRSSFWGIALPSRGIKKKTAPDEAHRKGRTQPSPEFRNSAPPKVGVTCLRDGQLTTWTLNIILIPFSFGRDTNNESSSDISKNFCFQKRPVKTFMALTHVQFFLSPPLGLFQAFLSHFFYTVLTFSSGYTVAQRHSKFINLAKVIHFSQDWQNPNTGDLFP